MFAKPKDEFELIGRWKNGDEKSFDALFALHFAKLHQFAIRHTHDSGLAEELAMDAMLKVWQQKNSLYEDTRSIAPLLFRILQLSLIDHYRKRKLETIGLEQLCVEPQGTEHADGRLLANQLQTLYRAGMDSLSPRQKLVFEMRSERDMSYREIAGELDLSTKTVDRHLSDAVISIRKHVSKSLSIWITSLICYLFLS